MALFTNYSKQRKVVGYSMVLPFFIIIFGAILYIAISSVVLSFQNVDLITAKRIQFIGFQNYIELFQKDETIQVIKNSIVWVFTATGAVIVLGIAIGTLLSGKEKIFKFTRSFMLIPWVLPGVVTAGLWKWMYHSQTGIINKTLIDLGILQEGFSWLGNPDTVLYAIVVVIVWRLFPLFSLVVASSISTIEIELYEAARVDGINSWQEFFYITIPSIKYQIMTMGLLNMIWIMNNLVFVNVMTQGGPLYFSEIFPVYMYKLGFEYAKLSQAAAITMINFLILLAMSIVYVIVFRKTQES